MKDKNIFVKLSNISGGALLAVLILIPVLAAGSVAIHHIISQSGEVSMQAAAEQNAYVIAEGAADIVLSELLNNTSTPSLFYTIYTAPYNAEISQLGSSNNPRVYTIPQGASVYAGFTARYITKKIAARGDAPPNSMAILVTARLYNGNAPAWNNNDGHIAEHSIYQELNGGLVKVRGCAANYDIYAQHDYQYNVAIAISALESLVYYTGNRWSNCGGSFNFSLLNTGCIDSHGDIRKKFTAFCGDGCGLFGGGGSTCNFSEIPFETALGYDQIDDPNNPGNFADASITKINVNGNDGNPYSDPRGFPWKSLEKDVIDHISYTARSTTTHAAALTAMQSDADVGNIGNWYFRDTNHDLMPDVDTPYFYHEGDLINALPFQIGMLRSENVYFYVNGNIQQFQIVGNASGLNQGNFYLIASNDIWAFDMMNISMINAGAVAIAGNDINNTSVMQGTGLAAVTMWANRDINISKGFNFSMANRMRLLAARDVIVAGGMSWTIATSGSSNAHCGCSGGYDETTDFAVGRRFGG